MKRLLIYPALVPLMAMLSAFAAIWQRELMFPVALSIVKLGFYWPGGLVFGVPFVIPAILLDLWRNKRRDCSLEELACLGAIQWFWFTLYASLIILLHWALVSILQSVTNFPVQNYLSSPEDFPYLAQTVACLWAIERVAGRKPSPSPAFLWHRWKRSWTLTTEK